MMLFIFNSRVVFYFIKALARCSNHLHFCVSSLLLLNVFTFNRSICSWQTLLSSWIRHSKLNCFFKRHINRLIVTKSLPLCINWVNRATREKALSNKALPINLIFVLFGRELLSDQKYLNQLSHSKSSSLMRRWMVLNFQQAVRISSQKTAFV